MKNYFKAKIREKNTYLHDFRSLLVHVQFNLAEMPSDMNLRTDAFFNIVM